MCKRHNPKEAAKRHTMKGFTMPRMNNDLYTLRRQVIDELYRIRRTYRNLPRLVVRIVEPQPGAIACGYAGLSNEYIHISKKWVNSPDLPEIVAHEIVHAVTGFRHDDGCILMSPTIRRDGRTLTTAQIDNALKKYLTPYK